MNPTTSAEPGVTVYVANFNYGRFIRGAIDSVLRQTRRDLEVIVIDDGSTDDSRSIIEEFSERGQVVPVFQHNRGLTVTNNIALRLARGRYIMRLDADDWLDEHAVQILADRLDRDPDVDVVFPDFYLADEDGRLKEMVRRHDFGSVTLFDQPAHGACTMFRTEVLRRHGGYDEALSCQDGYDLWVRLLGMARVQNINLPLFHYRQHGSSLTRNERRILDTRAHILSNHATHLTALGVVPVRGPAADPRSQALRPLGGRPLIDWTLEAALGARRLAGVAVSTPDDDIIRHVERHWAGRVVPLRRERRLAQINSFADAAVRDAAERWVSGHRPVEAVVTLYVESPFRQPSAIDAAVDALALFGANSVVSVRPEQDELFTHDGTGLHRVRSGRVLRLEAEEIYRRCGDVEAVRWDVLTSGERRADERVGHVVVDEAAALCLNSEHQWRLAEAYLAARDIPTIDGGEKR